MVSARIEETTSELFADCLTAFHAYDDLDELAEDLRILSLNAELAAGRAGDKGRAVRSLTQYTRALVSRLAVVQADIIGIKSTTYATSAAALRRLGELHTLEQASAEMGAATSDDTQQSGRKALGKARAETLRDVSENLGQMIGGVHDLAASTGQVLEVVSQSGSIATNIAIEAAAAGQYEAEFRTVAETMRRYVGLLRDIIDKANAAVTAASDKGSALQALAAAAIKAMR